MNYVTNPGSSTKNGEHEDMKTFVAHSFVAEPVIQINITRNRQNSSHGGSFPEIGRKLWYEMQEQRLLFLVTPQNRVDVVERVVDLLSDFGAWNTNGTVSAPNLKIVHDTAIMHYPNIKHINEPG